MKNFRNRKIWLTPCKHCPSANFPPDPESLHIKELYEAGKMSAFDAIFLCAWRPAKLCKGACDRLGITEEELSGKDSNLR